VTSEAHDLLGAYALGAVDDDDRRVVERAVRRSDRLRTELEGLTDIVAHLDDLAASDAPRANLGLWHRIETAINDEQQQRRLDNIMPATPTRFRRNRLSAVLSIAAVLTAALLGVLLVQLESDNRALEAALDSPLREAANQALADAAAARYDLSSSTAADGTAITVPAVYLPDGTGYVIGDSLPPLAPDRTYQLWAITEGGVISAGVLGSDPGIVPFQAVGELAGLAITEELAGGVVSSQNDPVAVWLLEA
jgi:anti-sigma-K factor RskA